jgi:hypothetical protein
MSDKPTTLFQVAWVWSNRPLYFLWIRTSPCVGYISTNELLELRKDGNGKNSC